jgi:hypothetical protein
MVNRIFQLAITGLLTTAVGFIPVFGISKEEKEARFLEQVKASIAKLGTGPQAHVEVALRDKRKVKGYISEANVEVFVITNAKKGTTTLVPYGDVAQVKGNSLSRLATVAITVAITAGILTVIYFAAFKGKHL